MSTFEDIHISGYKKSKKERKKERKKKGIALLLALSLETLTLKTR
jgi:hypothetical protein